MSSRVYTFTVFAHRVVEGDLIRTTDNFEVVEVLSETAFLAVRIGRSRVLWLRFKGWLKRAITRAAASLGSLG